MNHQSDRLGKVLIDGEAYYKITDSGRLRPFFMSITSAYDHWLFISSNGGLTAGRKNSEYALFPYYTCLLYTSPSPRDQRGSRMPSSA